MGLDMYLRAEKYISGYDFNPPAERKEFESVIAAIGMKPTDFDIGTPSAYVAVTIGYWRKANQIHRWFVMNVQDGVDDCRRYVVSALKLRELKRVCETVLADPSKAGELLPQAGVFFGGTAVDEWYLNDLKATIVILDRCLDKKFEEFNFYYRSSW